MEEGALTGLEEWGGFQGEQILGNPNMQRKNLGPPSFLSNPCPISEQGQPPRYHRAHSCYACNLLLFLPQTVPAPSRGQA